MCMREIKTDKGMAEVQYRRSALEIYVKYDVAVLSSVCATHPQPLS